MDRDLIFICRKLTLKFIYLCPSVRTVKDFVEMNRREFNLGVQIVTIIIFFNKIDKLPIIRYHTRGSQKLTQYVCQIRTLKI